MIRSTIDCGSSLLTTENMINNYMSFTDFTQYDWKSPTKMNGPDDPDPKTAKQAKGAIQHFFGIILYGNSEKGGSRKPPPKK
ncbi:hypothetical protein N0V85_006676 [Neurospora sp. IMI 360204]|nr:hypothetical protein N0V85_006676 [Neurospora sp. IMI 360204]